MYAMRSNKFLFSTIASSQVIFFFDRHLPKYCWHMALGYFSDVGNINIFVWWSYKEPKIDMILQRTKDLSLSPILFLVRGLAKYWHYFYCSSVLAWLWFFETLYEREFMMGKKSWQVPSLLIFFSFKIFKFHPIKRSWKTNFGNNWFSRCW